MGSMSWHAQYNFQVGGAICIQDGDVISHDSTFETNTAGNVSEAVLVVSRTFLNFPDFSLCVRFAVVAPKVAKYARVLQIVLEVPVIVEG